VIASPLRPRYRQESGIAAAGRLAHRGTPYGASLSFATTTHLWPLPDPPSRKPPQRNQPHWGPPGQFRAAPLPRQCRVPPVRVPGQDFHLRSQHPYLAHPRAPRPRARLRDDRRATQPRSSDDLESPSNWAGVAITARTQASLVRRSGAATPDHSRTLLGVRFSIAFCDEARFPRVAGKSPSAVEMHVSSRKQVCAARRSRLRQLGPTRRRDARATRIGSHPPDRMNPPPRPRAQESPWSATNRASRLGLLQQHPPRRSTFARCWFATLRQHRRSEPCGL
jgi:hypothetical protein